MTDNKLAAAILTLALNVTKPRSTPEQLGEEDWRLIVTEYQRILSQLKE